MNEILIAKFSTRADYGIIFHGKTSAAAIPEPLELGISKEDFGALLLLRDAHQNNMMIRLDWDMLDWLAHKIADAYAARPIGGDAAPVSLQ